jgi:hypothetical protein
VTDGEQSFPFLFTEAYRWAGRPFGVTPGTTAVVVNPRELRARFGPWRLRTPRSNVAGAHVTGPYGFLRTAGPAHLSLADRGLTMATNGQAGVCIEFREPVGGIDWLGLVRHPALTVTVADCPGLVAALTAGGDGGA